MRIWFIFHRLQSDNVWLCKAGKHFWDRYRNTKIYIADFKTKKAAIKYCSENNLTIA